MVSVGQIVFAKNGRDKGEPFIVFKTQKDNYVFIVNGKNRTLAKPKKKKLIHLQITNYVSENVKEKLLSKNYLLDAEIRVSISDYLNKSNNNLY